jgi:redox-sensitive bicupin YhaK (pirin superfamily)
MKPGIDVRRAGDRHQIQIDWLHGKQSFDTGVDPYGHDTHHGVLVVNNEDVVGPGTGFDTHPHQDMEIVTWVLDGALVHQDSEGNSGVVYPNLAQRMTAGTGILHSEKNDVLAPKATGRPVHFVQMWVVPDEPGLTPGYEQLELSERDLAGNLITIASGMSRHRGSTAIRIANRYAALHVARLTPGQQVRIPDAPFVHTFVPRGSVDFEGAGTVNAGDAVRLTAEAGHQLTALEPAEVLIWEMHAALT